MGVYHKVGRLPHGGRRISGGNLYMLHWTLIFLVIALIAGLLGFTGIAGAAATIAKVLFVLFLVLFLVALLFGKRIF